MGLGTRFDTGLIGCNLYLSSRFGYLYFSGLEGAVRAVHALRTGDFPPQLQGGWLAGWEWGPAAVLWRCMCAYVCVYAIVSVFVTPGLLAMRAPEIRACLRCCAALECMSVLSTVAALLTADAAHQPLHQPVLPRAQARSRWWLSTGSCRLLTHTLVAAALDTVLGRQQQPARRGSKSSAHAVPAAARGAWTSRCGTAPDAGRYSTAAGSASWRLGRTRMRRSARSSKRWRLCWLARQELQRDSRWMLRGCGCWRRRCRHRRGGRRTFWLPSWQRQNPRRQQKVLLGRLLKRGP